MTLPNILQLKSHNSGFGEPHACSGLSPAPPQLTQLFIVFVVLVSYCYVTNVPKFNSLKHCHLSLCE